jgi:hypothetical protein
MKIMLSILKSTKEKHMASMNYFFIMDYGHGINRLLPLLGKFPKIINFPQNTCVWPEM